MKHRYSAEFIILTVVCLILIVGEATVLLVLPPTTGMSLGDTYANLQPGSVAGVVIATMLWFALTAVVFAVRVRKHRSEHPRALPFLMSGLVCIGVAAAGLLLPWNAMNLALEHVVPGPTRYASPLYAVANSVWPLVWVGEGALVLAAVVKTATVTYRKAKARPSSSSSGAEQP
jgi:amino acid transporter